MKNCKYMFLFVFVFPLFSIPVYATDAPSRSGSIVSQDEDVRIVRLKLQCDPFSAVGSVKVSKKGGVAKNKNGKTEIIPPTKEQIIEQQRECDNQKIRRFIEPLYFASPNSDSGNEDSNNDDSDNEEAAPPPAITKPILIGPPDGTAYYGADRGLWLGTLWEPVPGASHMLCIARNQYYCPDTPRGVVGRRSDPDHYADMVEGDYAVREMPHFCYADGECVWSIAACTENHVGAWSCEYAAPFWQIRVTQ